MACKNVCKLCDKLIISTAVAYTAPNLIVTIPEGSYYNGEKYCIVVAQTIPEATTIVAPVVIQIGDGDDLYPVTKKNCAQLTACGLRTRTKYSTRVVTSATGGSFRLLGNACCEPDNNLQFIDGGETTPPGPVPPGP